MSLLQNDQTGGSWFRTAAILAVLLAASSAGAARPASSRPRPQGRVLVVRGAFTVFSLGLDELGKKLRRQGLNVEVTAASGSSSAAARIRNAYQKNPSGGPIVIIGHSLGGKLAPQLAREMKRYGIPVKLVLILDAPESMSIPSNVERCVNIYQSIPTGVVRGLPARAESRSTQMVNIDIARYGGLSINHFNIDSSNWIHDAVVKEVVRNCLPTNRANAPAEIVVTPKEQPAMIPREQISEALKKPPIATLKPPTATLKPPTATLKPPVATLTRPPAIAEDEGTEVLKAPRNEPKAAMETPPLATLARPPAIAEDEEEETPEAPAKKTEATTEEPPAAALKQPPATAEDDEEETPEAPAKEPEATTEKPPATALKQPPAPVEKEVLTAPRMLPTLPIEEQIAIDALKDSIAPPKREPARAKKGQPAPPTEGAAADLWKSMIDALGEAIAVDPGEEAETTLLVPWPAFDVERRSVVSRIVK